ncbi:MAG TPA: CocE/NonD family hydrolase, partial [Steroidobacteraceae bacterium]|nr:CocE/NonD family hydrolase [Steroidobacteraceae bacterium]
SEASEVGEVDEVDEVGAGRCVAALALIAACSLANGAVADEANGVTGKETWRETTREAGQRWAVPDFFSRERAESIPRQWATRLTGYIAARDGTALRFSLLLPRGKGPFPVIVNYSGYDPGSIGGYSYVHDNTAMSTDVDASLLDHGYAVIGVNARGTGCSEGIFDFLAPSYGTDGADVVEWVAAQPWATGAVGMANWSWAGMSQVATASERPPHLKAIAPGMALTDPRLDSWAIGGVPSQGFVTGWWMFLHSRWLAVRRSAEDEHDERCLRQVERNFQTGQSPAVNLPSQLLRHPLRDEWLEDRTILDKAGRIDVPVLSMESFQDEATTARAGYYQERVDPDRLWYIQTNGDHDLYESLQYRPALLAFFDRFVKGLDNGFEFRPHVEIWQETTSVAGAHRQQKDREAKATWIVQRARYPVQVELLRLRIRGGKRLSMSPDSSGPGSAQPDSYRYPVEGPAVNVNPEEGAWGELLPDWKAGSLTYTTGPLQSDLVIYGPASADLWVSSTAGDTDLQVTLTEVRPDGQERFVQRGWLRMSSRAQDPRFSTPSRPWPCDWPACILALTPGVPALGRVELTKVSYAFRTNSRIRIWIDAPSATGENTFDHSSLRSINSIWHDDAHPSQLVLGILRGEKVPPDAMPCGAVLMQPCRRDPMAQ